MFLDKIFGENLIGNYNQMLNFIPERFRLAITLILYISLLGLYSIFVFKFYRLIAKRNILEINLRKAENSDRPFVTKYFSVLFFIIEYLIIIPLLVFFWFVVFSFFLLLLSKEQTLNQVLLISVSMIGAIRATSYFNEDLSRDLAKLFPFTVLAIFLVSPNFSEFFSFVNKLKEFPSFFGSIIYYLIFIVILETVLRVVSFPFYRNEKVEENKEEL
jgi:hypothetical protein